MALSAVSGGSGPTAAFSSVGAAADSPAVGLAAADSSGAGVAASGAISATGGRPAASATVGDGAAEGGSTESGVQVSAANRTKTRPLNRRAISIASAYH